MKNRLHRGLPVWLGGPALMLMLALAPGCGEETDNRPVKWSYISTAIIQPSCATANCHSNLTSRSAVDLSEIQHGWDRLLGGHFVIRDCAAKSSLMALLRGEGTRRMPPTFALPNADILLIERWIDMGAPYDGPGQPTITLSPTDRGCVPLTFDAGASSGGG